MTRGEDELSSPRSSCSGSSNGSAKKKIHSVVTKQGANNLLVLEKSLSNKIYSMSEPLYSQNLPNKKEMEEGGSPEKLALLLPLRAKRLEKLKKEVFKRLKKYRIMHGLEKSLGLEDSDLMKYMENWESKMPPPQSVSAYMMVGSNNYMTSAAASLTNFGQYNLFNSGFNNR